MEDTWNKRPRRRRSTPAGPRPEATYDGRISLPSLLPVAPDDLDGAEPETTRRLVMKLARALRQERVKGRAGRPAYDPGRHLRLRAAFHAESRALSGHGVSGPGKGRGDAR